MEMLRFDSLGCSDPDSSCWSGWSARKARKGRTPSSSASTSRFSCTADMDEPCPGQELVVSLAAKKMIPQLERTPIWLERFERRVLSCNQVRKKSNPGEPWWNQQSLWCAEALPFAVGSGFQLASTGAHAVGKAWWRSPNCDRGRWGTLQLWSHLRVIFWVVINGSPKMAGL